MNADLGQDYLTLVLPTLDRQLVTAGLRLARINEIFVDCSPKCGTLSNHPLSMGQPLNLGELKLQLSDCKCSLTNMIARLLTLSLRPRRMSTRAQAK
jgi:hypothetical protein